MSDKVSKFKVGDKVKVVSHKNTVKRFRGDSANLAEIGTEGIVNNIRDFCVGITNEMFLLDMDDLILLDNLEIVNKETNTSQNESIDKFFESDVILPKNDEDDFTCCLGKGIESDGGSSGYYFTILPKHLIDQIVETGGIEIKDIIRYVFDNNADAFNIVKAQKRIVESLKGKGKAGITSLYDANKIRFFAEEQYNALNNKES